MSSTARLAALLLITTDLGDSDLEDPQKTLGDDLQRFSHWPVASMASGHVTGWLAKSFSAVATSWIMDDMVVIWQIVTAANCASFQGGLLQWILSPLGGEISDEPS